jgi:transcriptional regulator with GAF, ATPase, and Fis domain
VDLERYFMRVLSKQKGVRLALTPEAERTLLGYSFPNNIVVRGSDWGTDAACHIPAAR